MAVAVDTAVASSFDTTTTTLTWSHTLAAGATDLVVGLTFSTFLTLTSVKVGTTALTQIGLVNNSGGTMDVVAYGLTNPPTGAQTITVVVSGTPSDSGPILGGSISFTGSSGYGTAFTASGSSATASATVTSTTSGNMMVGVQGNGNGTTSFTTASGTSRFLTNGDSNSGNGNVAGGTAASTGSLMAASWSITSSDWGVVAFEVKAASGGGSSSAPSQMPHRRKHPARGFLHRKARTAGPALPPQAVVTQFLVPEQPDYRRFNPWRGLPAKKARTAGPPLPPQPVLTQFLVPQQPAERLPKRWFLRRAYTSTPIPAQQDPYHGQTLPPQQPGRRRLFQPRARARVATPPQPVVQFLPPQQPTPLRRFQPRFRARQAQPVPAQIVVATVQALPPQQATPLRRFQPRFRARQAQPVPPQVIVQTVQALPPQQPTPLRRFQPRARARVATPPMPVVQLLPPQQPRPVRPAWLPRPRRFQAQPVVIVYHPQALPPQQPTPLRRFQPRFKARQSQPVPAQVIITPHPIPPQTFPHRWRWIPSLIRRAATQTRFPLQAPTTTVETGAIFNRLVRLTFTGADPSLEIPGPWTVNVHGAGLAQIFADDAMQIAIPNPIPYDSADGVRFYAADGFYDVVASYQGVTYTLVVQVVSGPPPTLKTQVGAYWLVYDSRPTGEPWQ